MQFSIRRLCRRGALVAMAAIVAGVALSARADAIVYKGKPNLALTAAMVTAGGGPAHFSSMKLFGVVAGTGSRAEAKKLTTQFGATGVKTTFAVFDLAVNDVVHIVTAKHIALPPPSPSPSDGRALALGLYRAGLTNKGVWDVGYMLEHLMTHPIHHAVMGDIDRRFGMKNNAEFHVVLSQMMDDLMMEHRTALR